MAANVESMFSVRETPWHGLGEIVKEALTSEEAIKIAGLDWDVIQKPVYANGNVVSGYRANIRETDGSILGLVTDRYRIVQNRDAFSFTDELLGEGVTYETAGSLANGRRVWLLARLEGRIMTGERYDPYLVFFNSHDGSGAIKVAVTPVRVVCQNTLNLALRTADRAWSCMHKGDIRVKLDEARYTLSHTKEYLDSLEDEFGNLKLKKLTDDKVKQYVEDLLPLDEDEPSTIRRRNIEAMRKDLLYRYFFAPDLVDVEKSAYRFINAVSDFTTHTTEHKFTKHYQENLFNKTANGNPLIDKAYMMVKAA